MISNLAQDVSGFTSNVFLVTGERTVLVDPGNEFDVVERIRDLTGDIDAVVLTHTHPDHVGNLEAVTAAFGVEAWGFDTDYPGVDHAIADVRETRDDQNAQRSGDGGRLQLGDHEYVALHTPGHKNDHLCFHSRDAGILFGGDLVFAGGGFGRTDLDEGDRPRLIESIDYVLDYVGEGEDLHAGHGPSVDGEARAHVELAAQAARMG